MSYYYLISSLADLSPDGDNKNIDYEGSIDLIKRNLLPSDRQLFNYLLLPNDNKNLLNVLFSKFHNIPYEGYIFPAVYSEDQIKDYSKNKETFVNYLGEFIQKFEDQFTQMSPAALEKALNQLFFEELINQDEFLSSYFHFEKELTDLFASYNYSHFDILTLEPEVSNAQFLQLGKGKSIPAALLRSYPYLEEISEAVAAQQPQEIQNLSNRIKWDYLENIKGFFGREQVFVYTLKLMMAYQAQLLDAETGLARFEILKENTKNRMQSPQTQPT
ncbi:MAG: DUF2764 family protein [Fulvivirga sp.]|uniref:DUF2764 family protein n=1 Tax=Fulvivirga sp. TaxID=1931237 RepID=UPI0032EAEF14